LIHCVSHCVKDIVRLGYLSSGDLNLEKNCGEDGAWYMSSLKPKMSERLPQRLVPTTSTGNHSIYMRRCAGSVVVEK
jgi:hypothetical protein